MSEAIVVTVQERGRINLGKLATHERYFAKAMDDGTIILEPAVLVTSKQKELLDAVESRVTLRSFSEILEVVKGALPPTPDDVTILGDGTRIDSREAAYTWLADLAAERFGLPPRGPSD
jgi:hypothetical protein